jgi:sulfite reductase alpha subunit-like flavoprotein
MANSKIFREKKELAFEAYLGGRTDPRELAELVGCSPVTVRKWIAANNWDKMESEERKLMRDISIQQKKAYLVALKEYAKDPKNTALQSLVSFIKQQQNKEVPSRELNDYIVKFLDQVVDYMTNNNLTTLLKLFQANLMDIAEYLRVINR